MTAGFTMRSFLSALSILGDAFVVVVFLSYVAVKLKWAKSMPDTGMAFMAGMAMFGVPITGLSLLHAFSSSDSLVVKVMSCVAAACVMAWSAWVYVAPL